MERLGGRQRKVAYFDLVKEGFKFEHQDNKGYFSPLPEFDNELGGVGVRQPSPGQHVVLGRGIGLVFRVVLREPAGG